MRGLKHFFSIPALQSPELTIGGIGVQEHMPPSLIDRPHGTGDHLLMFFYQPVWIAAGAEPAFFPSGTLMVWTPGQSQYYGNRDRPYTHSWIHCNGTFICSLLRKNRLSRNKPILHADSSTMEQHLLAIHAELIQHSPPDRVIVCNLLENWLRATVRTWRTGNAAQTVPERLLAVRHYIESEHAQPLVLPDLAARAGLSVSHFCARFKQHFGMAPIEFLIQHRLHQAVHLLHDRELSISEAGRRVGYEDLFHFSKLFKNHFGVSPRRWRIDHSAGK